MPAVERGRAGAVTDDEALDLLADASLEPLGHIAVASNATLLCRVAGDDEVLAVYKPARGEAPLWDFPAGRLHRREVAAYALDRALGWGMVPPTVLRDDAPFGPGSVQLFVEHDPDRHYFALVTEPDPAIREQLQRMVVWDLVTNNADRKGSHVLIDDRGRLRLVDHGLTFHEEPKLRTVAWDFAGEPVAGEDRAAVAALAERLDDDRDPSTRQLCALLAPSEVVATARRARLVAELRRFPPPTGPRPFPWPPL